MKRPAIGFKPVHVAHTYGNNSLQAAWDGEPARPPRKGELYLSGALVTAYRAPADMDTPYFIAKEVDVVLHVVPRGGAAC
ncbi:hypothetical protein D9M68_818040 [compost metagenome]